MIRLIQRIDQDQLLLKRLPLAPLHIRHHLLRMNQCLHLSCQQLRVQLAAVPRVKQPFIVQLVATEQIQLLTEHVTVMHQQCQ